MNPWFHCEPIKRLKIRKGKTAVSPNGVMCRPEFQARVCFFVF